MLRRKSRVNQLMNKIVSSIMQIVLFALIPFIWWCITERKQQNFFVWIGLKKPSGGKKTLSVIIMLSVTFMLLGVLTLYFIKEVETATSEFKGLGATAIPAIVIYATFNTAFPEEILFRGFLLKRLINKFDFNIANLIQAFLFGLLHGIMFFPLVGVIKTTLIIIFTGVIAWLMGYVNERNSKGSILPSWMIHSVSNLFSGICAAFSII